MGAKTPCALRRAKNSLKDEIYCDKPAQKSENHSCHRHLEAVVMLIFLISADGLGSTAQIRSVKRHEVMAILYTGGVSLPCRYFCYRQHIHISPLLFVQRYLFYHTVSKFQVGFCGKDQLFFINFSLMLLFLLIIFKKQHSAAHDGESNVLIPTESHLLAAHNSEGIDERGDEKLRD